MDMDFNDDFCYKNFLEEYEETIAPKIRQIDILIKTTAFPITVCETSKILDISNDEVFTILGQFNLVEIDKCCFFTIMSNGSSRICQLFKREIECGSPHIYKPCEIAYIYDLDETIVKKVCEELSMAHVTEKAFPIVFAKIPAKNYV